MKSFAITLATWALLFALLWYGAHELFYPPADWIASAIVSLLGALGIGGLRKARIERRDAAIVDRSEGAPVDGARIAIAGTIEPIESELQAPFSGEPCIYYDYEISHTPPRRNNDDARPSPVIDRGGMALAPVVIRSGVREVRLLAFPGIERFDNADLGADVVGRARAYIDATQWEAGSIIGAVRSIPRLLGDRSGRARVDFRNTTYDDLEHSRFQERRVAAHAKVCAIGLYSAKDNAIVPQANVGGVRLISGTREEALHWLRAGNVASIIGAVLLLAIPGPVAYGVLSIRENYFEEHNQDSVRKMRTQEFHDAVATGDASAVRAALRRGVDVNLPNASGYPALAFAPNADVARFLLESGAKVDQPDLGGYTPVMLQSRDGRVDVVRLLVSHRADVSRPDPTTKMNALDIAIANGQDRVAAVLRESGARPSAK